MDDPLWGYHDIILVIEKWHIESWERHASLVKFIYLFLFSRYLTLTKYRKQKNTCLQ